MIKVSIAISAVVLGGILLIDAGYMQAKAHIAQVLLSKNWQKNVTNKTSVRPWPWADTYVEAKLAIFKLNTSRFVMVDASGESLAFGPGFITLNTNRGKAIAGHRDSHFAFLPKLTTGDTLELGLRDNTTARYVVTSGYVLDTRKQILEEPREGELVLITCYPIESIIPGGPLRYIVEAKQLDTFKNRERTAI